MVKGQHRGTRRTGLILVGLLIAAVALAWTFTAWDSAVHTARSTRTCGSVREPFVGAPINVTYSDGTKALADNGCNAALSARSSSLKIGLTICGLGVLLIALGLRRRRERDVTVPEDWLTSRDDDPLRH